MQKRSPQKKNAFFTNTYVFLYFFHDFSSRRGSKSRFFRSRGRLFARPKTKSIFASIFDRKSHQNAPKMEPRGLPNSARRAEVHARRAEVHTFSVHLSFSSKILKKTMCGISPGSAVILPGRGKSPVLRVSPGAPRGACLGPFFR